MKTDTVLICMLMSANDVALCAHSVPKLQKMCNVFSTSCDLFCLKISTMKIVTPATNDPTPCIHINGESLMIISQFCYLGSIIAKTATHDTEVSSQIGKAKNIFGKLRSHVWDDKYLTTCTKVKLYETYIGFTTQHGPPMPSLSAS